MGGGAGAHVHGTAVRPAARARPPRRDDLVLGMLEGGMREEEILIEYPNLEPADVRACFAYASELARVRFVDLPQAS
jgi:hypothetical protein